MHDIIQDNWTPNSWLDKLVRQLPKYPNKKILEESLNTIKGLPPLVTSWEIEKLKEKLSDVSSGKAFLLQSVGLCRKL